MNVRTLLVGLALLLTVGGGGFFGYRYYAERHRVCDLCGRPVYPNLAATVFLDNKSRVETCCPRCALHYEMQKPGHVARMTVSDSNTGGRIPAQLAFYVEGSDAETCHHDPELPPREPGVEFDRKFDRCMPSLIAFRNEAEARAFQKSSGGRVLQYVQAVQSVMNH